MAVQMAVQMAIRMLALLTAPSQPQSKGKLFGWILIRKADTNKRGDDQHLFFLTPATTKKSGALLFAPSPQK